MTLKTKEPALSWTRSAFRILNLAPLFALAVASCVGGKGETNPLPQPVGDGWVSLNGWSSFETPMITGRSLVEFDARVTRESVNAVLATSQDQAGNYNDLAAIVRFNPEGFLDARDGDAYAADAELPYQNGLAYHIEIQTDYENESYQVSVTPEGSESVLLSTSGKFRPEQAGTDATRYLSFFESNNALEIRALFVDGQAIEVPEAPLVNEPLQPGTGFWSVDFDTTPLGRYTDANLRKDWRDVRYAETYDRVTVEEESGNRYIRVQYPKGAVGHSQGGAIWAARLDQSYDELYMSYRIRFRPGFDFVKGGKLPGLAGGEANTGGDKPDGRDGFSARLMWQAAGDLIQYLYHPDQPSIYGEDISWNRGIPTGEWIQVENRIVMNTPGQRNGIVQAWYNGQFAMERTNIRFRDVDTFAVDSFLFSTFFGGNTSDWASTRDEYVDFDAFVFSDVPITH